MKRENQNFLVIQNNQEGTKASFRNVNRLTVLNSEAIRLGLLDIATRRNSELEIDLEGVKFIDSSIIDTLNLLSRMARRYNSRVILTNVSNEVRELITLVKMHSVFDIKHVLPANEHRSVA
jgi:anti-anti-sigma factor